MGIGEDRKFTRTAKAMAKGSLHIFIGNTSATVILALASILMARLLTPESYGLYSLTLVVPGLFLTFTDLGTNSALLNFLPRSRERGDEGTTLECMRAALFFNILVSSSLSVLSFFVSGSMAQMLLNRSEIVPFVQLASSLILLQAIVATSNSLFVGHDEARYSAAISITQAVVRFTLVLLVVPSLGLLGAVQSQVLGFLLASALALLLSIRLYRGHSKGVASPGLYKSLTSMLNYGFPIYSSAFLMGLLARYQSAVLAWHASNAEIGNYGIAQNFTSLVTVLTFPVSTMLLSSFSKLDEKGDLRKLFGYSVKYAQLIAVPACFLVAVTSRDLVELFYGSEYSMAPSYLTVYILTFSYSVFTIVLGNLFNGTGEVRIYFKTVLVKFLASMPLALILISYYRVFGMIASIIVSDLILLAYSYHKARERYAVGIDARGSIRIFSVSMLSAAAVLLLGMKLPTISSLVKVLLNGSVFLVIYLTVSWLVGAIGREDIGNLREMLKETPLAPIAEKILSLYEDLMTSLEKLLSIGRE